MQTGQDAERLVRVFSLSTIVIGRGADSDVILDGNRLAPSHARFTWDGSNLQVADLGSLAGVRVNNRRVNTAPVRDNDVITLGDVEVSVSVQGEVVELTFEAIKSEDGELHERVAHAIRNFTVETHLPRMRTIVLTIATFTILAGGVYPLVTQHFALWNSGPIANAHRLIGKDCTKCHATPFQHVQDQECQSCHNVTEHSPAMATFAKVHADLQQRCSTCHMEHNGDHGLILKDADYCVSCHASMPKLSPDSEVLAVAHFASHPQFRVVQESDTGTKERVSLDDRQRLVDRAQIKLNHAVHLKTGLRGPDGPTTLVCQSCHQLESDFKRIRPISFDSHCRSCHTLGFDERLPESQVPHGDAEAVYPALFTEYSKLVSSGATSGTAPAPTRRFPSEHSAPESQMPMNVVAVAENARAAETQLFTKTGCYLCHSHSEKPVSDWTSSNSHYAISPPRIPAVWFPAARFSHGAHEEFTCESCHGSARKSTETKDVLLPGIALCRDCHQQGASPGYVESGCGECHSYHVALGFPNEKKHTIAHYLRGLMR